MMPIFILHMQNRNQQEGFTLTEALIAIAILAGIAAAMAPALQSSFKIAQRIYNTAEKTEDTHILSSTIQRALDGIIQIPIADKETLFKGTTQAFQAISYGFDQAKPDEISISTKRNASGFDLFLIYEKSKNKEPIKLLQASRIEFSYFGQTNRDEKLKWHQNWRSKNPPKLIQLTATSKINETIKTTKFNFSLRGEAPLSCRFDVVSRRCRNE